jgi:LacI family transcriptional regulator
MFRVAAPLEVNAASASIFPFLSRPAGERPTAIFGAALTAALGVMVSARSAGLQLPNDLSLIGLDDAQVAELVTPGLTTVRMPHEAMGALAVESLLRLIAGEELPMSITEDTNAEIMFRGTTGPNLEKEEL